MPGHSAHKYFAYLSVAVALYFLNQKLNFDLFNIKTIILILAITFLYALLPDIDTPASKARRYFELGSSLAVIYFIYSKDYMFAVGLMIANLFLMFTKHRGFFHSFIATLLIPLPLVYFGKFFYIIGFLAYSSHLLLDKMFTGKGKLKI